VPVVGVVCEGPEDNVVIRAILASVLGEYELWPLHPETISLSGDFGKLGGGWKGVRGWCHDHAPLGEFANEEPLNRLAALVVHLDADVASDPEVRCKRRCPPASDTVDALRGYVLREWFREEGWPPEVVLCIPSKTIDAWALVALYPDKASRVQNLECSGNPHSLFPKERMAEGKARLPKSVRAYSERASDIAANWPRVCATCTQAARFDRDLRAVLQSAG
jgi:hypothetical protein